MTQPSYAVSYTVGRSNCAIVIQVFYAIRGEFKTNNGDCHESYFGVAVRAVSPVVGTVPFD